MVEAVTAILGLFSACIFVAHTVDAYRAKGDPTRDGSALQGTSDGAPLPAAATNALPSRPMLSKDGGARIPRPAITSRSFRIQNTRRNGRPRRKLSLRSEAGQRC
jgi:hypothetical protein